MHTLHGWSELHAIFPHHTITKVYLNTNFFPESTTWANLHSWAKKNIYNCSNGQSCHWHAKMALFTWRYGKTTCGISCADLVSTSQGGYTCNTAGAITLDQINSWGGGFVFQDIIGRRIRGDLTKAYTIPMGKQSIRRNYGFPRLKQELQSQIEDQPFRDKMGIEWEAQLLSMFKLYQ